MTNKFKIGEIIEYLYYTPADDDIKHRGLVVKYEAYSNFEGYMYDFYCFREKRMMRLDEGFITKKVENDKK